LLWNFWEALVRKSVLIAVALVAALTWPADCQHKVSSKNIYERVWAVVPIVGAGTQADPKRPLYAPLPGAAQTDSKTAGQRKGIIAFSSVLSDDRKFALVEFGRWTARHWLLFSRTRVRT
jgi:hypothetical protein